MRWRVVDDVTASVAIRGGDRVLAISAQLNVGTLRDAGVPLEHPPKLIAAVGNPKGEIYSGKWSRAELHRVEQTLSYVGAVIVPQSVKVEAVSVRVDIGGAVGLVPGNQFFGEATAVALPPDPDVGAGAEK